MFKKLLILLGVLFMTNTDLMAQKPQEQTINHIEIATILFYDGNYKKALEELQKAKESHTEIDWMKYHSMRGIIWLKEEKYEQAIDALNQAIIATRNKVYKAPVEEKEKKEVLFSLFSDEKKAERSKKEVTAFEPEKLRKAKIEELYIYLSQAYYRSEQYLSTVQALDAAGDRGRESASLFTLRAECYWKANEKASAIEVLNRGTELFPKDATL